MSLSSAQSRAMDAFVVKTARPRPPPRPEKKEKIYTQSRISEMAKVTHNGEIMKIKRKIKKLLKQPPDDAEVFQELVGQLEVLDKQHFVSLEALEKTKIGQVVHRVVKTYADGSRIRNLAKALVSKWKETAKQAYKRRNQSQGGPRTSCREWKNHQSRAKQRRL